jgi:hypothetical protein
VAAARVVEAAAVAPQVVAAVEVVVVAAAIAQPPLTSLAAPALAHADPLARRSPLRREAEC